MVYFLKILMILVINTYVSYQTTSIEDDAHKEFFWVFIKNRGFVSYTT
jgi:hypothetical protein